MPVESLLFRCGCWKSLNSNISFIHLCFGMFLAVCYHLLLITVLLHSTVWQRSNAVIDRECFEPFAINYSLLLCYYKIQFDKPQWQEWVWNVFSCLLSCIPYYCVITQDSLTNLNGRDRSGMFLAVYYHVFLITVLLHNTV